MSIPFSPTILGITINVHLILEYIAFFVAYRYYAYLRNKSDDSITTSNRLSIILGAAIGALLGSRIMGYLENPTVRFFSLTDIALLLNTKTIMGGLFGGLMGVEIAKKIIGEKQSSGNLFTLPIVLGIFIGRIGCFLSGTNEFTYGKETSFSTGMDLGDGVSRHPIALYELLFLIIIFFILRNFYNQQRLKSGELFQLFMIAYFGFRFFIEFIKPNVFFMIGLSSIQWLCIICFVYYRNFLIKSLKHAYKKIYIL